MPFPVFLFGRGSRHACSTFRLAHPAALLSLSHLVLTPPCTQVLLDAMHEKPDAPFAQYTEWRLRDLHALHALAMDANRQLGGPGEKG